MKKTKQLIVITAIALFMQGCSNKYGTFTTISTKKVDFQKKYTKGEKKVIGKDMTQIFFLFPTRLHPDVDRAVSDALEKSCADYLTDITLTKKHWYIPYIYGKVWFEVEGYPWFREGQKDCSKDKEEDK